MAATATATPAKPKMYEGNIRVLSEGGATVLSFTQGKECQTYGMRSRDAARVANQILKSIESARTKAAKSASRSAAPRVATSASKGTKKGGKKC